MRERFGQELPGRDDREHRFEQSYSGIDGDSASSTELYALLSALSGVPIRQDLAVTGSVDQYGTVQAIGGVNEKIEGFYRVCKATGSDRHAGRAGAARQHRQPDARCRRRSRRSQRGEFHIYPIDTIDQGIEMLTGVSAGTMEEPGTINHLVERAACAHVGRPARASVPETRVMHETGPPAAPKPPSPRRSRRAERDAAAAGRSTRAADAKLRPGAATAVADNRMRIHLMPIDLRLDADEAPLLTDLYELTMAASYFAHRLQRYRLLQPVHAPDAAAARLSGGGRAGAAARGSRTVSLRAADLDYLDSLQALHARIPGLPRRPALHRRSAGDAARARSSLPRSRFWKYARR